MNAATMASLGALAGPARAVPAGQPAAGKLVPGGGKTAPPAAPRPADLSRMVAALNDFLASSQRSLQFQYDPGARRTIITVIDPTTNAVVRQIPPDELLALARALAAGQAALLDQYA